MSSTAPEGNHLFINTIAPRSISSSSIESSFAEASSSATPIPAVEALRTARREMEALQQRGVPVGGSLVLGLSRDGNPESSSGYELHRFQRYSGHVSGGRPVILTSPMALRREEVDPDAGEGDMDVEGEIRKPLSGRFFTIDPQSSAADLDARCVW